MCPWFWGYPPTIFFYHFFYFFFPYFFPGPISIRIDTLWAQLLLEFSTDHSETMHIQAFKLALLFPTLFLCSYFSLLFSENALLSLLFSPKMFEVTKNCNFFPRSLKVCKNWINLI